MEPAQARYFTEHHNSAPVFPATLPAAVCDLQTAFFAALGTPTIRRTLDIRLHLFLAEHDPHAGLLAAERERLNEHGRN